MTDQFDIQIDLNSITQIAGRASAFRFRVQDLSGRYGQVSFEWTGTDALWQTRSDLGVGAAYGATAGSGKLRLTRTPPGTIRAFIWNDTLSQWEWNGDTAGIPICIIDQDLRIELLFFAGSTYPPSEVTIAIDNFYLWEGCAQASLSSSSSSSSCLSSSSSSYESHFGDAEVRYWFVAKYSKPMFVATVDKPTFIARIGKPTFKCKKGR